MNNKMSSRQSKMLLRQLELNLHLGWTEAERAKKQPILVDIMICFSEPPQACLTDKLENTYCYDKLIEKMTRTTLKQSFCLIEHLAYTIYELTHDFLSYNNPLTRHASRVDLSHKGRGDLFQIQITVTKKPLLSTQIPIKNVSFSYGNIK